MSLPSLSLRQLSFSWPSSATPLIPELSLALPSGFTGIVGPNGVGKSTLLRLVTGLLEPESGVVERPGTAIYCEQRTDDQPGNLQALLEDTGAPVYALRSRLGVEWDCAERWASLSHGERKRVQVACALWESPAVLALDEPSNHLDRPARSMLLDALRAYQGIGLVVSHDRELLDQLCDRCVFMSASGAQLYAGGYTAMRQAREIERRAAVHERDRAVRERDALRAASRSRQQHLERAERKRSKRRVDRKDHSTKAAINLRRVSDGKEGQTLRQLEGRNRRAEKAVQAARIEKSRATAIEMPGVVCRRDALFNLPAAQLCLGPGRVLRHPPLLMRPRERIALSGENGVGKSTLLSRIIAQLNIEYDRLLYLPQESTAAESRFALRQLRELPGDILGHAMNVLSCLGSRPEQLLSSNEASPGEMRKLLIALGMTRQPHLLVLDEPTNHLDLPSVEALEDALAQCACGLLLVSHDAALLGRLATVNWRLERSGEGDAELCIV